MKIAIMGAAGFIGTNLAMALLKHGYVSEDITKLVLVDEKIEYFDSNPIKDDGCVKIVVRNFDQRTDFRDLIEDMDVVFHLISTTNPSMSNQNISDEITVNIAVTANLLEACVEKKVGKIVFISSGGTVYGNAPCPIPETANTNPINTYGIQKLAIEKLLYLYHYLYGLDYRIARLSNPYGPYQRPDGRLGAVTTFTNRALKGETIEVYGDGSVIRDYIYIDDAVKAVLNISFCECKYKVYNVGSGIGISIHEVLKEIKEIAAGNLRINFMPGRNVDLQKNYLDIKRYEKEFGRIAMTKLCEGIIQTQLFLKRTI